VSGHAFGLIELLLVFGVAVGWAGWQLWSVRRKPRSDRNDDQAAT